MKGDLNIKAILLMGGRGQRFGSEIPKQFHRLSGKKVYLYTLETFQKISKFNEILLVAPASWIEEIQKEVELFRDSRIKVVKGGATRQYSSYAGLLSCGKNTDIVVIHDAVRPFVTKEIILKNIESAVEFGAVDTCIPSSDTIVHSQNLQDIDSIPYRTEYFRGQTPQSFSYSVILSAHENAISQGIENASDDCQLVLKEGKRLKLILGDERNIKITSELDLFLAEQLLRIGSIDTSVEKNSLKGKRFAITGGTGGIGREICSLLEKEGAEIFSISRTSFFSADLSKPKEALDIFSKIGEVDGLINCLGHLKVKQLGALSSEEIDEMIDINLKGIIFSCKYALVKQKGHIINIASSAFFRGRKEISIYSSSKAGVVNFTQALAEERPDLYINAAIPQRTNTAMRRDNFPGEDPSTLLNPQQVAHQIIALLKKEVTGTILEIRNL